MANSDITLVTVSDDRYGRKDGKYSATQDKIETLFRNNSHLNVTKFKTWKWSSLIQTDFYKNNKVMLDNPDPSMNGRAYKSYAVHEAMSSIQNGDFLIYTDTSPEMWSAFNINTKIDGKKFNTDLLKKMCYNNNGILTAHVQWNYGVHMAYAELGHHTHANFTLDRCINKMGLQQYRSSLQHASGMWVIQKSPDTSKVIEEWLFWNQIDECASLGPADTDPTKYTNHAYWKEEENNKIGHRHDQSISGLLINKMNNNLIVPPENMDGFHPYNFLQFAKTDVNYTFINSNRIHGS